MIRQTFQNLSVLKTGTSSAQSISSFLYFAFVTSRHTPEQITLYGTLKL